MAIPAQTAGLFRTRGVLPIADGSGLFITSEGSGRLLRYTFATGETVQVGGAFVGPTGIAYAPDGMLLVVDNRAVVRVNPATGEKLGTLVASGAGGVSAPTFLAVIPVPDVPAGTGEAVEYYHAGLDHYFISLTPAEIAALDSGALTGWTRTGLDVPRLVAARAGHAAGVPLLDLRRATGARTSSRPIRRSASACASSSPRSSTRANRFHIALPDPVTRRLSGRHRADLSLLQQSRRTRTIATRRASASPTR